FSRDWSSDVCSSDLAARARVKLAAGSSGTGKPPSCGADVRGRTLPSTSLCFFEVVDEGFGRVVQVDYRTTVPGTGRGAVAEVGRLQPDVRLLVAGQGVGDQGDHPALAVSDISST